jgi:hypothetical protein
MTHFSYTIQAITMGGKKRERGKLRNIRYSKKKSTKIFSTVKTSIFQEEIL